MKYFSFLFLFVAALSVSAIAQDNGEPSNFNVPKGGASIPMELFGSKPVVDVTINGKGPFKMFLDTAAGATVLNQDLADELGLASSGTVKIGDPANPQAIEAKQNRIQKLQIGDVVLENFIAVSFDRSLLYRPGAPRGVLGLPLFRSLLLTVDYPRSRILIDRGVLPAADNKKILDVKLAHGGIFQVQLDVAGRRLAANLDTGAQSAISFPQEFADTLTLKTRPVEVGRGRTVGGEAIVYAAQLDGNISLGEHRWEKPEVRFFGRLTGPNIGYGALKSFAITIDQQNWRIKLDGKAEPHSRQVKAVN